MKTCMVRRTIEFNVGLDYAYTYKPLVCSSMKSATIKHKVLWL